MTGAAGPRRAASLARALGLPARGTVAVAGAGGKTAAIRRLQEERPRAVATTTTHLGPAGFGTGVLATSADPAALVALDAALGRVRPLALALAGRERLASPPLAWQVEFHRRHRRALVLVEADGARRSFVKLPSAREPMWPPVESLHVVLVAGAGALGHRLADVAHRPQAFGGSSRTRLGVAHLERMLAAYLERCPPRAPVSILLTGIEPPQLGLAARLARRALAHVRRRDPRLQDPGVALRVVATPEVGSGPFWTWSFPRRRPAAGPAVPGVCGILLAAGSGRRYGPAPAGSKLLVRERGEPLVARAARSWARAGCAAQILVTGHAAAEVLRAARRGYASGSAPLQVVHNPQHARGLGSSVRAAARRAPAGLGLFFGHADMPWQDPVVLGRIARLGANLRTAIVQPTVAGRRVNPVYFPADLRRELARVPDPHGGRAVIEAHPERLVLLPVDETAGSFADVDRPLDLGRAPRRKRG